MSTKNEIVRAQKERRKIAKIYYDYFRNMIHNLLVIDNLPETCPKRYFLNTLFKYGKIAEYGSEDDKLYLPANGVGVDIYGLPTQYVLNGYNGYVVTVETKDVCILRLNDLEVPLDPYLQYVSETLADYETAILQNLDATRTMMIYECKDQATLLSLRNAYEARHTGALVAFETKAFAEDKLTVHDTGAKLMVNELQAGKAIFMNEALNRLGVVSGSLNKASRVQSIEVSATLPRIMDNVYVMVDTFNYDAETGGSKLRMRFNGTGEEFFSTNIINEGGTEKALGAGADMGLGAGFE